MTVEQIGLRRRIAQNETMYGVFVDAPTISHVETLAIAGFDFVIIDQEHGHINAESLVHLVSACDHFGIASLIRIPTLASWLIGPALDCGSSGVQVPFVSSAEEAKAAVAAARFAPDGERGVHIFLRGGQYGALGAEGYFAACNENQAVVLQVEGAQGVENLEAIAAVPGYDSIFIGPYDLSQSLGVSGQTGHPRVVEVIERTVALCGQHGKVVGTFVNTPEDAAAWAKRGVKMVSVSCDTNIFYRACTDLRQAIADAAGT